MKAERAARATYPAGLVLGVAVVLTLWVAIVNLGPLVYHDTAAYLERGAKLISMILPEGGSGSSGTPGLAGSARGDDNGVDGSRSPLFGLFLGLLAAIQMLDLALLANALVAVGSVLLVARVLGRAHDLATPAPLRTLGAVALASLGSLPFFVAYLMPDIFAPALILMVALLTGYAGDMRRGEIMLATALGAVAVVMHLSHQPIVLLLAVLALFAAPVFGHRHRFLAPALIAIMALVGFAEKAAFRTAVSTVTKSEVVFLPFITARLVQDKVGYDYLEAHCPDPGIATCRLWDALQLSDDPWRLTATHIIFESNARLGSFRLMTGADQKAVAGDQIGFFFAVLKDYPVRTVLAILNNTLHQARMNSIDMTIAEAPTVEAVRSLGGLAVARVDSGHFTRDAGWIGPLTAAQQGLYALSTLFLLAALFLPGVPRAARGFVLMVLLGILVNAFVCGAFSQPATRYGARVAWLLPAVAVLVLPLVLRALSRNPAMVSE